MKNDTYCKTERSLNYTRCRCFNISDAFLETPRGQKKSWSWSWQKVLFTWLFIIHVNERLNSPLIILLCLDDVWRHGIDICKPDVTASVNYTVIISAWQWTEWRLVLLLQLTQTQKYD